MDMTCAAAILVVALNGWQPGTCVLACPVAANALTFSETAGRPVDGSVGKSSVERGVWFRVIRQDGVWLQPMFEQLPEQCEKRERERKP
jgi:hypothetical protein